MAAIMALVFVPAVLAVVLMASSAGSGAVATLAIACFTILAAGMWFGAMRLVKQWEATD